MAYTMEDFKRELAKESFEKLAPEERQKLLETLSPEERLAGLSPEQIRQYLDQLSAGRQATQRKPRRKK